MSSAAELAASEREEGPETPESVCTPDDHEPNGFTPSLSVSSTLPESSRRSESARQRQSETSELSDSETIAMLREQLAAAQGRASMWEQCMSAFTNSILLSPEMNDIYKEMCSSMLTTALQSVDAIQQLHYVECSFPSVPSEAPDLVLERWGSLDDSEWSLQWCPSWSMQVSVEGSYYVQFKCLVSVSDLKVYSGRLRLRASADLSTIVLSFSELPRFSLKAECSVSWGSVPLPLRSYIEESVYDEFSRCLNEYMVAPNELVIKPPSFQPKQGLSDEDLEKAIRAVKLARQYTAAHES